MADLATSLTNIRAMVPGCDTTNFPDTSASPGTPLIPICNAAGALIFDAETPRTSYLDAATGGVVTNGAGGLTDFNLPTGSNTIKRILAVKYEGTGLGTPGTVTGEVLPLFTNRDEFELERKTYPGTAGRPRMVYVDRRADDGTWILYLHPLPAAAAYALSLEAELEWTTLVSASSIPLSPSSIIKMETLVALRVAAILGKDDAFMQSLGAQVNDASLVNKWLGKEESRGQSIKGEDRGRP